MAFDYIYGDGHADRLLEYIIPSDAVVFEYSLCFALMKDFCRHDAFRFTPLLTLLQKHYLKTV